MAKYFKPEEFTCPCCGRADVQPELVERLDRARELYGKPMVVTSGFRCEKHNKAVGGKPGSAHTKGEAADLRFATSADMDAAHDAFKAAGFPRRGIGNHFIHVDVSKTLPAGLWGYGAG